MAVHRIGDCYAPNFIAESIFSGHRLGREIDSPNPDRPFPFIRERRLLNASDDDYVLGSPTLEPGRPPVIPRPVLKEWSYPNGPWSPAVS